jgi:16S rRNA (guanine1516-N2)-methyltransferase
MPRPLVVDFQKTLMTMRHRQQKDARGSPLLRASSLGSPERGRCRVLDATAGLGRDAFQLARAGAQVTLLERNPIVFLLLQDGLARAHNSTLQHVREIAARMHPHHLDSIDVLQDWERYDLGPRPHVINLDPMYPRAKPSLSLPQYGMQVARYMR